MRENIILNYLECGQFLASDDGHLLVTYKQNERNFMTYQKKFIHDFEVFIKHQDLEYAQCVCLESGDIVIANEGIVYLMDGNSYKQMDMVDIELECSDSREPIVILNMNKSKDDMYIVVLVGK